VDRVRIGTGRFGRHSGQPPYSFPFDGPLFASTAANSFWKSGRPRIEQLEADSPAAPLQPVPVPDKVDQNSPHRFGGEEVGAAAEVPGSPTSRR